MATRGHVRDLPAKAGSLDSGDGFSMVYESQGAPAMRRRMRSSSAGVMKSGTMTAPWAKTLVVSRVMLSLPMQANARHALPSPSPVIAAPWKPDRPLPGRRARYEPAVGPACAAGRKMPAGPGLPPRHHRHVGRNFCRRRPCPDPRISQSSHVPILPGCEYRRSFTGTGFAPGRRYSASTKLNVSSS